MGLKWLLVAVVAACAVTFASCDRGGSSLRGALEALQRRQRSRVHIPQPDYNDLYEFVSPGGYPEADYPVDVEDFGELVDDPQYRFKLMKKKNAVNSMTKKESAFRERSHHSDNERLRDLFMDKSESDAHNLIEDDTDNDAEYALLLSQLWSKYKYNKEHTSSGESPPEGVVKLYKEKIIKKRYPDNWGPIAFKRKRSSEPNIEHPVSFDYDARKNDLPSSDPSYNAYTLTDDDKDDLREEYTIAFQPLDDDSEPDTDDEDQYAYDAMEKRFPVSKRSSNPYTMGVQKKRFVQSQNKRAVLKTFRSSAGTDPKLMKDLSKIFGDSEMDIIKSPVKRSSDPEEHNSDHEVKPPMITLNHNTTHEHNISTIIDEDSHEHHGHSIHHPGISGKEVGHESTHDHDHNHDHAHDSNHSDQEKPINIKKKSIDWSDYFGIDKRSKKPVAFINDPTQDRLRKQYLNTFNKEVIYPVSSFRRHSSVKRNYHEPKLNDETEIQIDSAHLAVQKDDKRSSTDSDSKLDSIDKTLKNMEGLIVDEALHYSKVGADLDSKEEQEIKEKILSRLAAAYSLEKMRKALKEFKQSMQIQRTTVNAPTPTPTDETKAKRVAVKKELIHNGLPEFGKGSDRSNDFEEEQGAGHYINGKMEDQFSEGYMGGSGRHRVPVMSPVGASGPCPVLAKVIQRCRGVDLLAGDRGQLFLPHCSLHQICYLCGEAPPTTCDLVFLSEADTTCEGDTGCQRAARSTLMALRELHDNLADELDGECEANPCLQATLKLNIGWQRAFLR